MEPRRFDRVKGAVVKQDTIITVMSNVSLNKV